MPRSPGDPVDPAPPRIDLDRPGATGLDPGLLEGAREVARRLGAAGFRTWVVGGAVRDLLLERPVKDVDLVSGASPERVEACFERTVAVGRAFGVVRVLLGGREYEVATFRSEEGYADGRRPDRVHLASSAEEDALRRDFTCNALYLDPLTGELLDPTGGLADLRARRLATVGDPRQRFDEDGLRLVRMARFEAGLGLEPAPGLHEAARDRRGRLASVSAERVLDELGKVLAGADPTQALSVLRACGLWPALLPPLARALGEDRPEGRTADPAGGALPDDDPHGAARERALGDRAAWSGRLEGLALLLDPDPLADLDTGRARDLVEELPLSRADRVGVRELWARQRGLVTVDADAARRARLLRGPEGEGALRLATGWARALGRDPGPWTELARWRAGATLEVTPLLGARDLLDLGFEPGPELGEVLARLEDEQLRGRLDDAQAARTLVRRWRRGDDAEA